MATTTITGTINGVNNAALANKWITFRLVQLGTDSVATATVAQSVDSVQTDANGDFSIDVWNNGDSGKKSILEITIDGSKAETVIIPTGTATIELWDLIENYQADGSTSEQVPTVSELFLRKSSNLSDIGNKLIASQNLDLEIGEDVQAHSAILDATDVSFTTAKDAEISTNAANIDLKAPIASPTFTGTVSTSATGVDFNAGNLGGELSWNDTEKTLDLVTGADNVTLQLGQEVVMYVRNITGSQVSDGEVVMVSGSQGNKPTITLAQADTVANARKTIGVATQVIPNNSNGFITLIGKVRDLALDGGTYTEGDVVYLSSTVAGGITLTQPDISVELGHVLATSNGGNTNGILSVNINNESAVHELEQVVIDNDADIRGAQMSSDTDEFRREVDFSLPSNDMAPIVLSESDFDDLTEYEPRVYHVIGVGNYFGGELLFRSPWQYAATDLHVAKTGNDATGDGSFALPYLTISHAFDQVAAAGGVTIWVNEGTYSEDDGNGYFLRSSALFTAPLVIQAVPNQRAVWTAASGAYLLRFNSSNSNITFKGIEFAPLAGTTTLLYANSTSGSVDNFSFIECFFNDTLNTNLLLDIRSSGISHNLKFLRNTIYTNGKFNNQLQSMDGAVLSGNKYLGTASTSFFTEMVDDCHGEFYFNNNTITTGSAGSAVFTIKMRSMTSLTATGGFTLNRNRLETSGRGVQVGGGVLGTTFTFNASRNYIRSGGQGLVAFAHINGGIIELNDIRAGIGSAGSNSHTGLGVPSDGSPVDVDNITIRNNVIRSEGGHALLVSYGSDGQTIESNVIDSSVGGDNACVIKGANHVLTRNKILGGSLTSLYLKGSDAAVVSRCHIINSFPAASALEFARESLSATPDSTNCSVTGCLFEVTDGGMIEVATGSIGTGNVVDNNSYLVTGTATWGAMFGALVSSLADIRASWEANYDVTTNDANSIDL